MTRPDFTPPQHLPGMPAWLFEYDLPDGTYGIVINGSDPQSIIEEFCDLLPGLRLLGEYGGKVSHDPS